MDGDPGFFCREVKAARRFVLDPQQGGSGDLAVMCGGWERCSRGYAIARAGFPWLALEVVAAGYGEVVLAGVRHELSSGAVFAYGPGIPHRIVCDPCRPMAKYFLDLRGPAASHLIAAAGLGPGRLRRLPRPVRIQSILDLLIETGCDGLGQAAVVCANLAEAALRSIADEAIDHAAIDDAAHATYRRCRELIEASDPNRASIAVIAAEAGVTPAYLCRLFRRYDRMTPGAWLRRRSLQSAADALLQTSEPVTAIAARLGYSDAFHFSRAFKRLFGIAPLPYRRQARGLAP